MNHDNTKNRKNENLHALYSILDYCEEPYICRREMQLNFLGEEFDAKTHCKKMCDNCKKNKKVVERDCTVEAKKLIELLREFERYSANVTLR